MFQIVYYTSLGTGILWPELFVSQSEAHRVAHKLFPKGHVVIQEGTDPSTYV